METIVNSQSGSLSVTINTVEKLSNLYIKIGESNIKYELSSEESLNLAKALLSCHGNFEGYKSYMLTFSKEPE